MEPIVGTVQSKVNPNANGLPSPSKGINSDSVEGQVCTTFESPLRDPLTQPPREDLLLYTQAPAEFDVFKAWTL